MSEPRLDPLPAGIHSATDYEAIAHDRLDPVAWRYLHGGSGAGLTLTANRRAFAARTLMPRPLADVGGGYTRLDLFGQTLAHPLMLAPIAPVPS